MNKETEEKEGLGAFAEENMFDTDSFMDQQEEEDEKFDLEGFDGIEPPANADVEEEEEEDKNGEDDGAEDDDFNFDGTPKGDKTEEEIDIELFNKQFNTKFTKQEELKEFIEGKEKKEEVSEDDQALESAQNYVNMVSPLIQTDKTGRYLISDEALMKKQLETVALGENKDLNDSEVQYEINEALEEMKDNNTLKYEAKDLRRTISDNVNNLNAKTSKIIEKREQAAEAQKLEFKKDLQKEFISLHGTEKFFGLDNIDKKTVAEAYRKASSGEFLESLKDKKVLAELSLIAELKEKIFKKASGLTYNDGMKAVLDEFKSKAKADPVVNAQKRGTTANDKDSQKGLIDSILYTKPKKETATAD